MPNLIYSEIRVRNLQRSVDFYRVLGLVPKKRGSLDDGTSFVWIWDKKTRQLVELWYAPRSSQFYEPFRVGRMLDPRLMISVWKAGPILLKLKHRGGKVIRDDRVGDFRLSVVEDPDGNSVEIVSWTIPQEHPTDMVPLLDLVLSST